MSKIIPQPEYVLKRFVSITNQALPFLILISNKLEQ
jgi:hypothetical protein